MPKTNTLDFSSPAGAEKALQKIAQQMGRAGQSVVSSEFNQKPRRSSDTTYREAFITLSSGQLITLRVNGTGDIYQVLLNGSVKPLKEHTDTDKAIAEIASMAEKNQGAFQKAQARKAVALPKGMGTTKPKQVDALVQQVSELDTQISERKATIAELQSKLGVGAMTDSVPPQLTDLDDNAREVLGQLAKADGQAVEDGDLISKEGRDTLIDLGLIDRYTDKGDNVLNDKGRACVAMLDSALAPAPVVGSKSGAEPMSWLGFKLVNQVFVDELGPMEVPSRFQIGASVFLGLGQDGDKMDIAAKVIGANFRSSKVHYTLAVPIQSTGDQPMYAVLYDVDSVSVASPEEILDSATQPQLVDSLDAYKAPLPVESVMSLASSYVAARELAAATGVMLDDASTDGAKGYLEIALDIVENNGPIHLEEGNIDQARLELNMAKSFRAAIAMLDSASGRQMDDKALDQLVAIAKVSAASENEIADQDALTTLLALSMVDVAEGIYFLSEKGRQHLNDNGMDAYGEPFAE
ncbi:hypothetical protein KVG88_30415 [Pseudomonas sp. SWRI74]|uniref:Defence against restriction A N-terminal domain-containing protein n=1 Tax=Pseudomonas azerbaijanoccidentalis TaxID=2842347 RepID=A0ABS6R0N5_9PSED|nr:hypothetical protein [Pseudomonas azerbaijanoccidentalis]MBV4524391.1 hypothetical protein [Pseudomonas azerbaijanoccidentalis]